MAYKAAPAVAIAGVLVAAQPVSAAVQAAPVLATATAGQIRASDPVAVDWRTPSSPVPPEDTMISTDALVVHQEPARSYTVQAGDTLSSIALRFYGSPLYWMWIYAANKSEITNPGVIFPGQVLTIPPSTAAAGTPAAAAAADTMTTSSTLSGTLSCAGLEDLWEQAGGSDGEAFMAAEIAMAESGGQQYALSPTSDYGYWQINGSHGPAEATFSPIGNAEAAVAISDDGTDWDPWTTYVTGAYAGRC